MKEQAEAALGCKVYDAVVTIPSHFNELQREATKSACHQAELNILRMINEPTAAALAYGIQCKVIMSAVKKCWFENAAPAVINNQWPIINRINQFIGLVFVAH